MGLWVENDEWVNTNPLWIEGVSSSRAVTDSVGSTDARTRVGSFVRSLLNSVGITDSRSRSAGLSRSVQNSVGVTDSRSTYASIVRIIADSVGITTVTSRVGSFVRAVADLVDVPSSLVYRIVRDLIRDSFGPPIIEGISRITFAVIDLASKPGSAEISEAVKPKDAEVPDVAATGSGSLVDAVFPEPPRIDGK